MRRKMTMREIESEARRFDVIFPLYEEEEGLDMNEEVYNLSVHVIISALMNLNEHLGKEDERQYVKHTVDHACNLFDDLMCDLYQDKWWNTYDTIGSVIQSLWITWPQVVLYNDRNKGGYHNED